MLNKLLSQSSIGTFNYAGSLGEVGTHPEASTVSVFHLADIISTLIGFLTVLAGIWFMIQLITGAFAWISAGGDKQKLDTSKKKITNAVIGLFIIVVSYAIIAIIGGFFGLDIINLSATILNLNPDLP